MPAVNSWTGLSLSCFCPNCIKNIQTELWRFRGIFTRLNLRNTNKLDTIWITVFLGLIDCRRLRDDVTAKDFFMADILSSACFRNLTRTSHSLLRKSRDFVAPASSPLLASWLPGCCCFKDSLSCLISSPKTASTFSWTCYSQLSVIEQSLLPFHLLIPSLK